MVFPAADVLIDADRRHTVACRLSFNVFRRFLRLIQEISQI